MNDFSSAPNMSTSKRNEIHNEGKASDVTGRDNDVCNTNAIAYIPEEKNFWAFMFHVTIHE
jgi:hypothetical protein